MFLVNQGFSGDGEPGGEFHPRVFLVGQIEHVAAEELRLDDRLAQRMPQRRLGRGVDDLFFPLRGGLEPHLGEECAPSPNRRPGSSFPKGWPWQRAQPILTPMNTRAVALGDGLRVLVGDRPAEVGRAVAEIAPAGRQQLADELVVGLVLGDALADPEVIAHHGPGPEVDGKLALDPQQVAPLQGPEVGKLLALQQPVDELAPLLRVGVASKRADFVGRGQRADGVEIDASQEHLVRSRRSDGGMPSFFKLANTNSSILLFGSMAGNASGCGTTIIATSLCRRYAAATEHCP